MRSDGLSIYSQIMSLIDQVGSGLARNVAASTLESDRLEFKEPAENLKRTLEIIADAVICMANASGGHVVLGIRDSAVGLAALVGVGAELSPDVVVRGVFDRTRPSLSVPVDEATLGGCRLLVLTVPKGATFYANAKGTATRRIGTECRPFPPEEQKQALASRGLYDWSAQPCVASDVEELDADEVARLRRLLRAAGKSELASADTGSLLSDLRLVTAEGELTRAGLLLLGRPDAIQREIPTYSYAYQYRPHGGAEATARFRQHRPLLAAVEQLIDAVETRRTVHPLNIAGGVQVQLHDYPSAAVRELVVNALVHRDYEVDGSAEVDHSPDRLVVSSPGGLVFGVTPDNILTHPSTPRSRLLLESVTLLQVAERTGQGVDRVYRELLRAGKHPPAFDDHGTRVEVTLPGGAGNDAFVRFVTQVLNDRSASDIEILLALDHLCAKRSISAAVLAPRIQRSQAEAQRTLERLVEEDLVEPSRRTSRRPYPTYALTPAALSALGRSVVYHRRTTDGIDQKVIEHVREYGFITNQTIRRLFDLGIYPARDLLRDLQAREILTKLDDKKAGPGVRYGPGPRIPKSPGQGSRR